jgi:hypothetical protein
MFFCQKHNGSPLNYIGGQAKSSSFSRLRATDGRVTGILPQP